MQDLNLYKRHLLFIEDMSGSCGITTFKLPPLQRLGPSRVCFICMKKSPKMKYLSDSIEGWWAPHLHREDFYEPLSCLPPLYNIETVENCWKSLSFLWYEAHKHSQVIRTIEEQGRLAKVIAYKSSFCLEPTTSFIDNALEDSVKMKKIEDSQCEHHLLLITSCSCIL